MFLISHLTVLLCHTHTDTSLFGNPYAIVCSGDYYSHDKTLYIHKQLYWTDQSGVFVEFTYLSNSKSVPSYFSCGPLLFIIIIIQDHTKEHTII